MGGSSDVDIEMGVPSSSNNAGKANPHTTMPLAKRTLANSNYKRIYDSVEAPGFQHQLLGAVHHVVSLFAERLNPTLDPEVRKNCLRQFMKKLEGDAFRNDEALQEDVGAVSEYLWTSGKTHEVVNDMELCSILNEVIRDDHANEVEAAAIIFRGINTRRVNRGHAGASHIDHSFPTNGETWRGGGFRQEHKKFFQSIKGKKYRVPGFLSTTNKKAVAAMFAFNVDKTNPSAMWRIVFDPRGESDPRFRVKHMTFVSKTLIKGEGEYLFAPYSVFTLQAVSWSTKLDKPHQFTIHAACDNKKEDENLPLAPWY